VTLHGQRHLFARIGPPGHQVFGHLHLGWFHQQRHRTTGIPFFADCQKQSAKTLKQVAKALPTALHMAVGKEHVVKNSSAKKPLPPAKRKAVGKAFATCQYSSRQRKCTPL